MSVKKSSKFAAPNASVRISASAAGIELTREQVSPEFLKKIVRIPSKWRPNARQKIVKTLRCFCEAA
jgi:hypothetical protein